MVLYLVDFSGSAPWCLFVCGDSCCCLNAPPPSLISFFTCWVYLVYMYIYIWCIWRWWWWRCSLLALFICCCPCAMYCKRISPSLCVWVLVSVRAPAWECVCLVFIYEIHECFGLSCRIAYLQPRLSPFWPGFLVGCSSGCRLFGVRCLLAVWLPSNGAKWWPPTLPSNGILSMA